MHSLGRSFREAKMILFLVAVVFSGAGTVFPQNVFASTTTDVLVRQVLPPGAQTCPALGASGVHPYIYDGVLHSFDISITDPSYVALIAQVGDETLPFRYMSRWRNSDGTLRIHVDIPMTALAQAVPIHITLLAANPGGKPITCLAVLSAVVPAMPDTPHNTNQTGGATVTHETGAKPSPTVATPFGIKNASYSPVTALNALGNMCNSTHGAGRLWLVLFVLYALFTATLVFQKDNFMGKTRAWSSVLVVGLFLILVPFWFVSATCRTGSWAPILITCVAFLGISGLMFARNEEKENREPLLLQGREELKQLKERGQTAILSVDKQSEGPKSGVQNKGAV